MPIPFTSEAVSHVAGRIRRTQDILERRIAVENVSYYAQEVSRIFPERRVIGLAAYTVSDSVIFCEFKGGDVIRLLQSGFQQERKWEKIEGEPQPWEDEILKENSFEIGGPGMMSFDIQQIGQYFDMPGFGVPGAGEAWTKEIWN